jgi:hypothetical protein
MIKYVRKSNTCFLVRISIVSIILFQTMIAAHAQTQFMDYFMPMPVISSLSSSCWGAAAVGPRDQSNGLEDKAMTQYCYWDGGIIKGSDGVYHMFASRWAQSGGHNGWFGSVAVHATSNNLYGPYTDQGLCWPNNQSGKGHNVFPFLGGDGKYYIIVSDTRPGDIFQATSLNGPWTQLGTLSYSGNFGQTANISVMYRPDGRYMAVPRSGVIALSNNVLGTYAVQGNSAYEQAGVPSGNLEDPVVWYSGGKYHIVVNKWDTRKAYHITSTDGITGWTLGPGLAYDPTANFLRYTNGTVNHWNKLERFNIYIENGQVIATTFAAIDVAKDQELGNDQHGSKVIIVPFDGASLDGGTPVPTAVPTDAPTPGPSPMPGTVLIACGSSTAVESFQPDQYYSGGTAFNNTNTVDVSLIGSDTPPAALFNNERYGAMSYTIPGFTSGSSYTVTLYFAETYLTSSGSRVFNVSVNGTTVLPSFDIYASAGGQNKAIAKSFTTTADSSGQIAIQFTAVTENPKINGISINPGSNNRTLGDVNGSGTVDIVDALLIAQYYVGLNPQGFIAANADVNCSGGIDIVDALLVAQYYVGLISIFPC